MWEGDIEIDFNLFASRDIDDEMIDRLSVKEER